jgi:peptidoglycan/LPS O-acetylase OafA/YrhL
VNAEQSGLRIVDRQMLLGTAKHDDDYGSEYRRDAKDLAPHSLAELEAARGHSLPALTDAQPGAAGSNSLAQTFRAESPPGRDGLVGSMQPAIKGSGAGRQLQSLTPLRGIAALWVVLYHYAVIYFPSLHPESYSHFLQKGYLAVDLFFMLSGFVLAHVYHDAFNADASTHYRKFLLARVARLYPLHLFVLCLFLATAIAARAAQYAATGKLEPIPLEGARSLGALVANLFMLQGLKASELSWNYPAWSISVEFMAYLAFPFVLPLIWRARWSSKVLLAAFVLGALACFAYWTKDDFNQWDGPKTLLRCLPEFVFGMLLYGIYRRGAFPSGMSRDTFLLAIVASLLLLLHFGAIDLLVIFLFPALVMASVVNTGYAAALLNTWPLMWLGNVSYSLYLIHGFIQFVTTKLLDGSRVGDRAELSGASSVALLLAMLCASLVLATVTYYAVEKAGRRYLRNAFGVRGAKRCDKAPPIRS